MRKIRVLVVDDSVMVRRLMRDVLAGETAVELAGTAGNGAIALVKIDQLQPDVVTLDVEMPVMDGLATLREIRKRHPRLPVIMFSTATERGAAATIDALAHGANDYVAKTPRAGVDGSGAELIRSALLPKIIALCPGLAPESGARADGRPGAHGTHGGNGAAPAPAAARPAAGPPARCDILAIASSTGGPNALAALLPELPGNFPVPVVIVQHMPPMFTRLLAENLAKKCRIGVTEAVDGEPLRAGHALIAPGDFHLSLERRDETICTRLHRSPPENSCRPAADVLFRDVAELYPGHALAVILTGMGQDGRRGGTAIVGTGGRVIVQDEASSVVWGMAGSAVAAGIADGIFPLTELAAAIMRRVAVGRPMWFADAGAPIVPAERGH